MYHIKIYNVQRIVQSSDYKSINLIFWKHRWSKYSNRSKRTVWHGSLSKIQIFVVLLPILLFLLQYFYGFVWNVKRPTIIHNPRLWNLFYSYGQVCWQVKMLLKICYDCFFFCRSNCPSYSTNNNRGVIVRQYNYNNCYSFFVWMPIHAKNHINESKH